MSPGELLAPALLGAHLGLALLASGHALLYKRDPRAAWSWILSCALLPFFGVLLYWWFGINRIERRARRELGAPEPPAGIEPEDLMPVLPGAAPEDLVEHLRLGRALSGGRALRAGNRVAVLHNGEQAYPAMLAAIAGARQRVWLMSYLFDAGVVGRRFAEALAAAVARGVEVRVLLDGVGDIVRGTRGSALLRHHGVPVRLFLPPRLWPPLLHVNLRNHRKLLCVDGQLAYLGGINIGDHHLLAGWPGLLPGASAARMTATDLHFQIEGPVCRQLAEVYAEDWQASGGEPLALPATEPPPPASSGQASCRVITDGPNTEVGRLQLLMLGALANARRRVRIMTPYFIPTPELSGALQSAAMRGVAVEILIPERGDNPWLDAATRRWLGQLLHHRVRVWRRPAPFAHAKLFLVDEHYALIGSANLDPRSLRLNFELMLEVYDQALLANLHQHYGAVAAGSPELSEAELLARPLGRRLRDSLWWLLSPYL
ncbi:MAG: phospholipase D-like domain-containing protein [Stagnimonas sp.]|nr:phospholipase D-like domain-containing protein [Stagnimonas sp.]